MKVLGDGGYAIRDEMKIDGEGVSVFVFGRGWLLEVVDLTHGDYCFYSDGEKVRPMGRRFGVFYPTFSMVRAHVRDVTGSVTGVGAVRMLDKLPDRPVMFETDFRGEFSDVAQALAVLAEARNIRSIEINTRPSLISIKCKKLIDENYQVEPSIARIAARLEISHEHMTRQFKRDFGMSPSEYLHHVRVADATFRLQLGDEIIDVSGEVGYNDLSRFYKQFRKKTATSPGECRTMFEDQA
jgi:AraC-like DNA-binding protein